MWKNNGFSLLELMLSILFGSMILSGIYEVYLHAKSFYITALENYRLEDKIRFTTNYLVQNITAAGYSGCNKVQYLDLANSTMQNFSFVASIQGFTSSNPPLYLTDQIVPDTDGIIIQKADLLETLVISDVKVGASKIKVKTNPAAKEDRILLISDCHNGDLFKADNYTGNDIIVDKATPITHAYSAGVAMAARFMEVAFFISNTSRKDKNGNPIYALYEVVNGGNKQEITEDIKSMKIKYGLALQNEGIVDTYLTAAEITSSAMWEKVLSIVITLMPINSNSKRSQWSVYIKLRER